MTRDVPLRERKLKKRIEDDPSRRAIVEAEFPAPAGTPEFTDGYRECIRLYALHAPDKRGVAKKLDDNLLLLEQECLRAGMNRGALARYEGYRQAMKDLRAAKRTR